MKNETNELKPIKLLGGMLSKVKHNVKDFLVALIFISNALNYKANSLFAWVGTKIKMTNELNEIFEKLHYEKILKTGKGFDTFVDVFGGGLNSTLVLKYLIQLTDIKKVIVNEIDKCVYQTHLDCKEKPNELIEEFSEIIRTKFLLRFGTIFISKTKFESVLFELVNEFNELQSTQNYSVKSSIRFIILRDFQFSGNLEFDKETGFMKMASKIYCYTKMYKWFFRQTIRIQQISKIYNDLDIQIHNKDCFELLELEGIKNNPNALINLDPPYVKQSNKSFTVEELEKMTDNELEDCRIDYNQKFPHIKLLKLLPMFNFIYNNNKHAIVDFYSKKANSEIQIFDRLEKMVARKGKKVSIVKEYILYNNSLIK